METNQNKDNQSVQELLSNGKLQNSYINWAIVLVLLITVIAVVGVILEIW